MRLTVCLLFFATTLYSNQDTTLFNLFGQYANTWLIITRTDPGEIKCETGKCINTSLFSGLKPGLFICIAGTDLTKTGAARSQKQKAGADSYIKYAGCFIDPIVPACIKKDNLLFTTGLDSTVFLTASIKRIPSDDVYRQQGVDSLYQLRFDTRKCAGTVWEGTYTCQGYPQFRKCYLNQTTCCL